jgi:hypothetical protein
VERSTLTRRRCVCAAEFSHLPADCGLAGWRAGVHTLHFVFCAPHSDINYTFSLIINPLIQERSRERERVVNASSVVINLRGLSISSNLNSTHTHPHAHLWIYIYHIWRGTNSDYRISAHPARSSLVYCKMIKFSLSLSLCVRPPARTFLA